MTQTRRARNVYRNITRPRPPQPMCRPKVCALCGIFPNWDIHYPPFGVSYAGTAYTHPFTESIPS